MSNVWIIFLVDYDRIITYSWTCTNGVWRAGTVDLVPLGSVSKLYVSLSLKFIIIMLVMRPVNINYHLNTWIIL